MHNTVQADFYRAMVTVAAFIVAAMSVVKALGPLQNPDLWVWLFVAMPLMWYFDREVLKQPELGSVSLSGILFMTTILQWGLFPSVILAATGFAFPLPRQRRLFNFGRMAVTAAAAWIFLSRVSVKHPSPRADVPFLIGGALLFWLTDVAITGINQLILAPIRLSTYIKYAVVPTIEDSLFNMVFAFLSVYVYKWIGWGGGIAAGILLFSRYRALQKSLQLREQNDFSIQSLVAAVEARDPYTRGHSDRVAALSRQLAQQMGLPPEQVALIRNAAQLHDVGKVGIPDEILTKPGRLTDEEYLQVQTHPLMSERILGTRPDWAVMAQIAGQHHERWAGHGYPRNLAGEEIRVEARIIGVADAYDAMTSTRSYRSAKAKAVALAEIERCSGTQFDPIVAVAFITMMSDAAAEAAIGKLGS